MSLNFKYIKKLNIPEHLKEFKQVLFRLKEVHTLCNAQLLPSNYHKILDDFKSIWFQLKDNITISTTPKIHIILDHIEEYFDNCEVTLVKMTQVV
jgi:hypothetical protein